MSRCPHCNAEIDHVNYSASYTEWGDENGTCDTNGDDWQQDERDSNDAENGDATYTCPQCNAEIEDLDEIINDDDEEDPINLNDDDNESAEDTFRRSVGVGLNHPPITQSISESLTDGGNRLITRGGGLTSRRETMPSEMNRTVVCEQCHTTNFPEGDNAIICSNCNNEIIIN